MPARLLLVSLLTAAPATAASEPATEPDPASAPTAPHRIATLVLQVDGMAPGVLRDAIELRAPDLTVRSPEQHALEPPADPLFAYALVHATADAPSTWTVTVILSDGRAFFRTVDAQTDTSPRVVATTLVNLVRAAEAGTIVPDATRALPDLSSTRTPAEPVGDPPADDPAPILASPPRRSPVHLGVGIDGALMTGFGPPAGADSLVAGAGGLGIGVRLRNGLTVTVSARTASRMREQLRVVRLRASAGIGYTWRREAFELIALGYAAIEPWWLSGDDPTLSPQPATAEFSRVLAGGGVRVAPGYYHPLPGGHALHLGVRTEADGAAMTRGGVGLLAHDEGGRIEPLFRLGGFSLNLGVELIVWFSTSRRDRAASGPQK